MIYTLTCNPSLDIKVSADTFNVGKINKSNSVNVVPGGKGINISTLLAKEGMTNTALGFVGGNIGRRVLEGLHTKIIKDFIEVDGDTRINIKINKDKDTEFNGVGPKATNEDKDILFAKLSNLNRQYDLLIISGSVLDNLKDDFYEKCVEVINDTPFIIDARGPLLLNTLKYHPELVKPNIQELEEMVHKKIKNNDDLEKAANKLLDLGAKRVLVSMGEKGVYFASNSNKFYRKALKGKKIKSCVGAGDGLVAGFVSEFIFSKDEKKAVSKALKMASEVVFKGTLL